jgi:uncharacterized membrane protein YkvA (DUF1232 family)
LKNKFFDIALRSAARLAGKNGRIALLIGKLGYKMTKVNWKDVKAIDAKEKFFILGRLSKAYATGKYRHIPWKSVLIILAAIIYFVNPIDLVPDVVPLLGLTDDVSVLLWVYQTMSSEVDKFLAWEKTQQAALTSPDI